MNLNLPSRRSDPRTTRAIPLPIVFAVLVACSSLNAASLVRVVGGGAGGDGGPALDARLAKPFCVAFDKQGNLYLGEFEGHRIRRVDRAGSITTVAGTGEKGFSGDGGPAARAQIDTVHDLVVAGNGDLFIADTNNKRVRKVDATTGIITTIAGDGSGKISGDGGPADRAGLDGVGSLFFSPAGDKLYVSGFSKAVRVIDMKSNTIDTVRGVAGGRSIAVDSRGNLYVAGGVTLKVLATDRPVRTLLDATHTGGSGSGLAPNPKHLAIDADDNVYIADEEHHQVRKYVPATDRLTLIAGDGQSGSAGLDGPAERAQLARPHGLYFNQADGMLYIADSWNDRIVKVKP